MKLNQRIEPSSNQFPLFICAFLLLIISSFNANAQSYSRIQNLNFGSFITYGNGGTISISPTYIFDKTGDVVMKNSTPVPAIFDLYVDPGKTVQLTYNKNITLVGDHGGSIALVLSDSSPLGNGSVVTSSATTRVIIGGTLTIGAPLVSPVGNYLGSFQISITVIN